MKRLGRDELGRWCGERGYRLDPWPAIPTVAHRVELPLPSVQVVPDLIDYAVNVEPGQTERLVWIADWTIWNERSQEIGLAHLALLRRGAECVELTERGHAYMLAADEWRTAVALLLLAASYGWDAYLFFGSGTALVEVSHDEYLAVSLAPQSRADAGILAKWKSDLAVS